MSDVWHQLSWQQRDHLSYESKVGRFPFNCAAVVPLASDATVADLASFLNEVMGYEDALKLRLDSHSTHSGTWRKQRTLPGISVCEYRTEDEVWAEANRRSQRLFSRGENDDPLWSVSVLRQTKGKQEEVVCVVFDHLICDAASIEHLANGIHTLRWTQPAGPGTYLEWLQWQRTAFDSPNGPSADFWRAYLDGTPANRRAALPGSKGPPSGRVRTIELVANLGSEAFRRACSRLKTTGFPLVLAATAAALARQSNGTDITVNALVSARPPKYRYTIGWLANAVPLRVTSKRLKDGHEAFIQARSAWAAVLPHQYTPNKYIRQVCGALSEPQPGAVKVELNYQPVARRIADPSRLDPEGRRDTSECQIKVDLLDGRHAFACTYDTGLLDRNTVRQLLNNVVRQWEELVQI